MTSRIYDDEGRSVRIAEIIDLVKVGQPTTLRDQFALVALKELIVKRSSMTMFSDLAKQSYQIADAMLEERGKKL